MGIRDQVTCRAADYLQKTDYLLGVPDGMLEDLADLPVAPGATVLGGFRKRHRVGVGSLPESGEFETMSNTGT